MNRLISSAISAAFLSGLVSMSWADRPDGEPTCSFTGGAFYSSNNTLYLESFSSDGAAISVTSEQSQCVKDATKNKTPFKVIVERNTALTNNSTLVLPVKGYQLAGTSQSCMGFLEPSQMSYNESTQTWRLEVNSKTNDVDNNHGVILSVDTSKTGCKALKEIELTATSLESLSTSDFIRNVHDSHSNNGSNWYLVGAYVYKSWDENPNNEGTIYGYAAKKKGTVSAGQFVKIGGGAYIPPLRLYLRLSSSAPQAIRSNVPMVLKKEAAAETFKIPETIDVVIVDKKDNTTNLKRLNSGVRELRTVDSWYDLKGRKLKGKPANKGMFVGKTRFQKQ